MSSLVSKNDSKTSTDESIKGPTKIKLLLDRSGSMQNGGLFKALIKGVNSLLLEQKQLAEDIKSNPEIEVWVFDISVDLIRSGEISDVVDILEDEVQPRGATALNDAMASILDSGKDDTDVLFFIFTDGQENSSVKYRGDSGRQYCKSLVEMYSRDKNWTVIFGAANIDAYQTGAQYGIRADNAFNVSPDAPTIGNMMREVSDALRTSSCKGGPVDMTMVRQVSAPSRIEREEIVTNSEMNDNESVFDSTLPMLRSSYVNSTSPGVGAPPPLLRSTAVNTPTFTGFPASTVTSLNQTTQEPTPVFGTDQSMMPPPTGLSRLDVEE